MSGASGWEAVPRPPRTHEPMSGAVSRAVLWPWIGLLVISLAVAAAMAWQILPATIHLPSVRSRPPTPQSVPRPAVAERRRVRLFFPQEASETLKELEREIPHRDTVGEEVRAVLRELATAVPEGRPPVPPSAGIRHVFLDAFGILYLDFSKDIQVVVAAPATRPEFAISAIVNSLTASFSEIKRVQFLVEGKEMIGTAGGWDLRRPIGPRFPGGENPPIVSQPQE